MMEVQRPLLWHQGLLLQPQHFQLLDRSFQSLLVPFQKFLEPYFWGIGEIDIERAGIGRRTFALSSGTFLFPDGAYAVLHENARIESRSFDEAWIEGHRPFPVYVGLKKWDATGENVTVLESLEAISGVTSRFVAPADPDEVKDLHSGGPPAQVKRLYYLLKVVWETEREQMGDYHLIPVAQLERAADEVLLSERFVPPTLTLSSSKALVNLVKEIRDQVAARANHLEQYKTQRGIQTAEFGTRDLVYLLTLRSLARNVPILFHYTESQQVHPWAVYGALRQLIGELSTFSGRINVIGETEERHRRIPLYDHRNLWDCFSSAQRLISELLDEITAGPDYIVRLVYDGTYHAAALDPALFEGRNRYYLVCSTESDPKVVRNAVSTVAKLSSREHLPILIARALPGLGLEHLPVPPQELPRRAHSVYYAVDSHSDQWSLVEKNRNLALYWDDSPDDLEVELMVIQR